MNHSTSVCFVNGYRNLYTQVVVFIVDKEVFKLGRLDGKVALITGAARGQGAAEAELFAKEGAKVIITDLQEEGIKELANKIKENGGIVLGMKHDVSNEDDWQQVVNTGIKTFGKIDILVNNAGILSFKTVTEISKSEFEKILSINTTGTFLGMKYVIPNMQKNGGGSIVNISSLSGIYGVGGAGYNASKGAVRTLTKNAAVAYGKEAIRVNSVHPGTIDTPMIKDVLETDEDRKSAVSIGALPYIGQPIDVAYCVLFLASDESRFITGGEYLVDGGTLIM